MAARTARPLGAQQVGGASSVLPVGPSGYPLPLDEDETLRVHDTSVDSAVPRRQISTLDQMLATNQDILRELRLIRARLGGGT